MHHWHHPGFHRYYRRAPSRFLWFVLGAGTAYWAIKHRQLCSEEDRFGFCRRTPMHAPPGFTGRQPQQISNDADGATASQSRSQTHWDPQWEKDKARLMEIGKQASTAASEVSEATLDSILETMTSLKAKIAQRRAEREQSLRQPQQDSLSRRIV